MQCGAGVFHHFAPRSSYLGPNPLVDGLGYQFVPFGIKQTGRLANVASSQSVPSLLVYVYPAIRWWVPNGLMPVGNAFGYFGAVRRGGYGYTQGQRFSAHWRASFCSRVHFHIKMRQSSGSSVFPAQFEHQLWRSKGPGQNSVTNWKSSGMRKVSAVCPSACRRGLPN